MKHLNLEDFRFTLINNIHKLKLEKSQDMDQIIKCINQTLDDAVNFIPRRNK